MKKPIVASLVLHGLIAAGAIGLGFGGGQRPVAENYVDLGYETFDAPPQPVNEVRRVVQAKAVVTPAEPNAIKDNSAKELQDAKSDIAGQQQAKAEEPAVGSEGQGQAASTPYYKIKPKYPRAALVSGLEGWVLLEIDITENGEVENIRVVGGEQRNTFQSEARRAVALWKYRPFVDPGGRPTRKLAHHVRVDFKLTDQEENIN